MQAKTNEVKSAQKAATERLNHNKPYLALFQGTAITPDLVEKFKDMSVQNLSDGSYRAIANKILASKEYDASRAAIMADLYTLGAVINGAIKNNVFEPFKSQYRKQVAGGEFDTGFANVYGLRKQLLALVGYNEAYLTKPAAALATIQTERAKIDSANAQSQYATKRDEVMASMVNKATNFPITLDWSELDAPKMKEAGINLPTGNIAFDSTKQVIVIGDKKFAIAVKPFEKSFYGLTKTIDDAFILDIRVNGSSFELIGASKQFGKGDPMIVSRAEMAKFVTDLYKGNTTNHAFASKIAITAV